MALNIIGPKCIFAYRAGHGHISTWRQRRRFFGGAYTEFYKIFTIWISWFCFLRLYLYIVGRKIEKGKKNKTPPLRKLKSAEKYTFKYSEFIYVFHKEHFLVFGILMKYSKILLSILFVKKYSWKNTFKYSEYIYVFHKEYFLVFGILMKYSWAQKN